MVGYLYLPSYRNAIHIKQSIDNALLYIGDKRFADLPPPPPLTPPPPPPPPPLFLCFFVFSPPPVGFLFGFWFLRAHSCSIKYIMSWSIDCRSSRLPWRDRFHAFGDVIAANINFISCP